MGDSDPGYQFGSGIGEDEVARLEVQGAALAPATRMILAEAGIRPAMRVLDLGCGAGDVAFVAAGLAGPGGSVVGVDLLDFISCDSSSSWVRSFHGE